MSKSAGVSKSIVDFLRIESKQMPAWLSSAGSSSIIGLDDVLRSRAVYYPGGGSDGQPVRTFCKSGSVHLAVYADVGYTRDELMEALSGRDAGFRGYRCFNRRFLEAEEVATPPIKGNVPFALLELLERDELEDRTHGPHRIAVLFVSAEANALFKAWWCEGIATSPFAVVIHDHGFGGNFWSHFGAGGYMEQAAVTRGLLPRYLLIESGAAPWHGYERVAGVEPDLGGMHRGFRVLYQQTT